MKEIITCFDKLISALESEIQECEDFIDRYYEFSNRHGRDQYYEEAVDRKSSLSGRLEQILQQQKALKDEFQDL